ncbi:MAG TPA: hypothetical protein VEW11_07330 [Gaiellaceae bacterium]|nr:hypothetical protein [Gaiellaceae bacterium]
MKLPDRGQAPRKPADDFVAAEEAGRLSERATAALARADGVDWYVENGTAIDEAAFALTRLRRAQAGLRGGPQQGDEAVRRVLEQASPEAVRWLASRAISYMDESGYPEAVEPWFQELLDPHG